MRSLYFFPCVWFWSLLAFTITLAGCYPDDFDKASWGPEPELTFSSPGVTLQPSGGSETVTVTTNYDVWTATVAEPGRAWCSVQQSGTTLTVTTVANPDEKERTTVISVEVGKGKKEIKEIAVTQLGMAPRIVSDPPAVGLPMGGGSASVKITTNLRFWTPSVAVGSDWCNISREGDGLTVSAGSYSGKQQREGLIAVSGEGESGATAVTTVKVIQLGSDPVLNASDLGAFSSKGGRQSLVVLTNLADWEATVPSTASWCRSEKNGTTLTLQVDANSSSGGRRCEVLLTAGSGDGMLKKNIPVVQLGKTPELLLSSGTMTFDGDESVRSITVFTEEAWTAETESSWCTLLPGDQTLTVYAEKNPSTTAIRRGTVNIRSGNLSQTLEIVQRPYITLALSVDTLTLGLEGGTHSVTVVTNQSAWNVSVPDTADWCRAVGEGNQLTVTVGSNVGVPREAVITVLAGPEGFRKSVPLLVRQEGVASDRDVLIAFYKATGGDNWTNNTNWCSDKPLSEWYGVTTAMVEPQTKAGEAVERVTGLDMSGEYSNGSYQGNNLVGTLPAVIGNLTELKKLNLFNNRGISGNIPAEIGLLTNLEYLSLAYNQLSGPIPPELGNLTNLTSLILRYNQLSGSIPLELGNLTNLTSLSLEQNQLSGSIPPELGNLVNLTFLSLWVNQLSGPIPSELGNLTKLITLQLACNQLSGSIPLELGNLTKLELLWLNDNQLSGSIPLELGNLTELTRLCLERNQLSGNIPSELGKLINLTQLWLWDNRLTGSVPPEVQALPNWDSFNPDVYICPQQEGYGLSY